MMKYPFLDLTPVNAPFIDEIIEAQRRVALSGRFVGGEEVDRLEAGLCALTGATHEVIPAEYFLIVQKLGLAKSLSYAALCGLFVVVIISILTFKRCYFKIANN